MTTTELSRAPEREADAYVFGLPVFIDDSLPSGAVCLVAPAGSHGGTRWFPISARLDAAIEATP